MPARAIGRDTFKFRRIFRDKDRVVVLAKILFVVNFFLPRIEAGILSAILGQNSLIQQGHNICA